MNRRGFLLSSVVAAGSLVAPALSVAATQQMAIGSVVLTDLAASRSPELGLAVVRALREQGVWVTCALDSETLRVEGTADLIEQLIGIGGVELAVAIDDLGVRSPWFQGRAVFDAQEQLRALTGDDSAVRVQTVLTTNATEPGLDYPSEPTGVRSAGIRNVLVEPTASARTTSETWDKGVVRFFGGTRLTPSSDPLSLDARETVNLFYISANDLERYSADALSGWAKRLAGQFIEAEISGRLTTMSVSDLQLRDYFGYRRLVAIRLVGGANGFVADLDARLKAKGIVAETLTQDELALANGGWVTEPEVAAQGAPRWVPVQIDCSVVDMPVATGPDHLAAGIGVLPETGSATQMGLDPCGILRVPEFRVETPLPEQGGLPIQSDGRDLVLTLTEDAFRVPLDMERMYQALVALQGDGVTEFVSLDALANSILSRDPIEQRYNRTEPVRIAERPTAAEYYDASDLAAFREDAKLAWSYFETYTDRSTGLCPATVDIAAGGETLNVVTMWDVGSQINGIRAAQRIGLIDRDEMIASIRRILPQIRGRESQERLLPQGWIRTDRDRWGNRDFDGCDVGRLLASLDGLRAEPEFADETAALVASWDLEKVLIDGVIYSVKSEELVSTYESHCAHYAARAFERWGLPVASPYRTFDDETPADGRMKLLEETAQIGPLGAEPLLLEAVELGMSRESRYLSEVLYQAQLDEFEATGDLIAVGETPITDEPWFIYQGLQLGEFEREWAIDTVGGIEEFRTQEFLADQMAVTSKAAFLWAAYWPGEYSRQLLDHVRERAKLSVGFAANVNRRTGLPSKNYTDLNTNGIILQAIASILEDADATQAAD